MAWPPISNPTWNSREKVKSKGFFSEQAAQHQRIAILGIGNEQNGDDAAGVLVARELKKITGEMAPVPVNPPREFLIVEAGLAPEAFTGPLRRFHPDLVILVDAAELGESPGAVSCFDWSQAEGMSASTHTLPPTVLAQFLMRETGCEVMLIGIQPKNLSFDAGVSAEILQAIRLVINELCAVIL